MTYLCVRLPVSRGFLHQRQLSRQWSCKPEHVVPKLRAGARAGDYTPVQQDQMDLASMVDCAFSMADWSTNHGATPSASYASPRSVPTSSPATALDAVDSTTAELRALDSMYTALSSLGLQVCSLPRACSLTVVTSLDSAHSS